MLPWQLRADEPRPLKSASFSLGLKTSLSPAFMVGGGGLHYKGVHFGSEDTTSLRRLRR